LKLFGRDKDNEEKPIIYYYAKQIGVLGTNVSLPIEEDAYVYLYEDRIDVKLLKRESRTVIPYKSMIDLQNMDAGNNNELRRTIHKHALESKLLGAIGHAELEKEIQKTVKEVSRDKDELEKELEEPVELDELELEKYIEFVVKEVRKASKH
jgi:hypothetical protein